MRESNVLIHDEAGFQGMRKAGALAADVLDMITEHVKKGTTTQINATTFQVEDALIELNRNSSGGDVDAGIYINRSTAGNVAVFYWNEGDDKFKAVTSTSASIRMLRKAAP